MKFRQVVDSLATFLPGARQDHTQGTGGTDSARYCYSVWLRHLVMAKSNGLNPHPKVVAELGPGNSLGIGLAALITGCDQYFAFDVVEHANSDRNLKIFDELVILFKKKAPIPGDDEFPRVKPYLSEYDFPADILDNNRLQHALEASRLEKIRDSIMANQRGSLIEYKVPWYDTNVVEKESVDMIYSQAVLEHVDELENTNKTMCLWLKPNVGYMSHQIDFKCHGTADEWNGHWVYSNFIWKVIRGRREYLINREPYSTHMAILKNEGCRIVYEKRFKTKSSFIREELAKRFQDMDGEDLTTSGVFVQAVKIS